MFTDSGKIQVWSFSMTQVRVQKYWASLRFQQQESSGQDGYSSTSTSELYSCQDHDDGGVKNVVLGHPA